MRISDMLSICWRNLTRRKLRTALTAFGVVIGVCSILVMISIGIGLEKQFDDMLQNFGDLTIIEVNSWGENGEAKLDDAAIAKIKNIKGVVVATPFYSVYDVPFQMKTKDGRYEGYMNLYGVYPEALPLLGYNVDKGQQLAESKKDYSVVVGNQVAYNFRDTRKKPGKGDRRRPWPDQYGNVEEPFFDMTKQKIIFSAKLPKNNSDEPDRFFEITPSVVGVLEKNDKNWDANSGIFMDITEAKGLIKKYKRMAGEKYDDKATYDSVKVKCSDVDSVRDVQDAIEKMGFGCYSMENDREYMQKQSRMIQLVLGGLAAISLFVAAIGIANTMVMSIIERTKEIGIMKVIGAETGNIRLMFLMEAGMIGLIGGVVGVISSFIISFAINRFAGGIMGGAAQISIIPMWLVGFALFFSVLIGIIFGFLPANRAVKISALEAIKHD